MKNLIFLLSLAAFPGSSQAQDSRTSDKIISLIEANYVDSVDGAKLKNLAARKGLSAVFKELDPYSQYLSPETYKELTTAAAGNFGGVGMQLQEADGRFAITGTIPGSPAYRAGVMPGERILTVDGSDVAGLKLPDVVKKIRGEPGTLVRFLLASDNGEPPREIKLTRETVQLASPRGRMMSGDVGYLQVAQVNATTAEDIKDSIKNLKGQGMRRLVLDLRDNGGGLLSVVTAIASLFLEPGKLVLYTQGRTSASRHDYNVSTVGPFADLPLAVLVNGGTASGSEIIVGALQDYGRALLVGSRTYGKGRIQSLYPLPDGGALKLSFARCRTPKGRIVERGSGDAPGGFVPDVPVAVSPEAARTSREYLESLLRSGAPLSQVDPDREPALAKALETLRPGSAAVVAAAKPRSEPEPPPPAPRAAATASDVDAPAYRLDPRAADYALIIGVGKYSKLPDAPYAERDAETVRKHMVALGLPPRNMIFLSGPNATRGAIQGYVEEWLPKNVKPESTVFVYYSGHGAPDPQSGTAYLVPWDGDASFLQSTAYPLKRLYGSLSKLRAKGVLIALDSCFSGAGGRSVLAKGARPLVAKVQESVAGEPGLTLLAAASNDQITGTLDEQEHGLFTYFLLKGLSGAARDKSGKVTAKSLYTYLRPNVEDEAHRQNREQTPAFGGQDLELARFR